MVGQLVDLMKQRGENRYTILDNGVLHLLPAGNLTPSVVEKRTEEIAERTPALRWVRSIFL